MNNNSFFKTHLDVLKQVYNIDLKCHRKGAYQLNNNELIWFPDSTNKDWGNAIEGDYYAIWELIADDDHREWIEKNKHLIRHTFMKFKDGYKYIGDYEYDLRSTKCCNIFKRVLTNE